MIILCYLKVEYDCSEKCRVAMVLTTEWLYTQQFRRLLQMFRIHFDSMPVQKEDTLNMPDSHYIYLYVRCH